MAGEIFPGLAIDHKRYLENHSFVGPNRNGLLTNYCRLAVCFCF